MKAFVTVTQQQFDISAEQGVPAGDVLTQSVEFGNFIKGKDGSVIYNGSGVPANILGVNGDFYIDNVAPNNYYEKISGVWVLQGHFQGAQGEYTVITIGENGNWYIDGEDSGQRAIGIDGYTPIIGENDNWWINGADTSKRAVGIDGVGISNWELLSTIGKVKTYRITFTDSTTFEYSITDGTDGNDGREVLIQNNGTYIQWKYEGDETWTNIVALTALKGDSGANIELQKSITHIQWRVVGDLTWIDLVALVDLKGNDGRGIVSIIKTSTVGLVDTYTITYSDSTTSTFDVTNGDSQNEANIIEEVQVNSTALPVTNKSVNVVVPTQASDIGAEPANSNIQQHISDETIHHTIDELDELYEPKNSNIQEHIADTDIHVTTTDKSNWDAKADLDEVLKLDQTTPQTITQSPKINDLVAGKMCYVDSNKQLKPIDVFWDNVNKRMGFGTNYPSSPIHVSSPVFPVQTIERTTSEQGSIYAADRTVRYNSRGLTNNAGVAKYFALSDNLGNSQHAGSFGVKWINSTTKTMQMYFNAADNGADPSTGTEKMVINGTGEVGIATIAPKSKLQVAGGIQCGDDTAAASANKKGTTRYREWEADGMGYSTEERCMKTGINQYTWVAIVTNSWTL